MGRNSPPPTLADYAERATHRQKPPVRRMFDDQRLEHVPPARAADKAKAQLLACAEATSVDEAREFLATLGLSTSIGTRLIGFGQDGSQVRVFVDPDSELCCQWCRLGPPDFTTKDPKAMAAHLRRHRLNGDTLPLWAEDVVSVWRSPKRD